MLQAVIFDFDGVIVDTEPLHYEAFASTLPQASLALPRQIYFERYVGLADREILRRLLLDARRPTTTGILEELQRAKDAAFRKRISQEIVPLKGVVGFVNLISRRWPLAICSGAKRVEIEMILKSIGLHSHFQFIVTSDDVPTSKPDPAGYLLTLEHLRTTTPEIIAARCVVIEDSVYGIQAAKSAGMRVLAVRTPYNTEILREADTIVDSLVEVDLTDLEALVE